MSTSAEIAVVMNLFICLIGGWVCVCRMAKMSMGTKRTIRTQYMLWFSLFVASAISWTYDEPANLTQIAMGLVVLTHLVLGASAWRLGPPAYARR